MFKRKPANPARRDRKKGVIGTLCLRDTILRVSLSFLSILFHINLQTVAHADSSQHSQISRHKSRRLKTIEMKSHLVLYSTKPYRIFWSHSKRYVQLQDWGIAKNYSCFISPCCRQHHRQAWGVGEREKNFKLLWEQLVSCNTVSGVTFNTVRNTWGVKTAWPGMA